MSISVQNLTKRYKTQAAIDQISFEIKKGQVVGFLGPNGAGKSTTMKILTCFMPQTEGIAKIAGYNTLTHSIEIRREIGYLPEHNPLYLDMFVLEYLSFVANIFSLKNKRKQIDNCIELTGLTLERKKKIGQLSKGYRQRVGLAQALLHNPSVLILDEPTSGLDPNQVTEIRKLIRNLGEEKTVLLSTHQLQDVEAICDRTIIINRGKIVADKFTVDLKSDLGDNILIEIEFIEQVKLNFFEKIDGILKTEGGPNNFTINATKDANIQAKLWEEAVKNKLTITKLNQKTTSLEDVFKNLTTNANNP